MEIEQNRNFSRDVAAEASILASAVSPVIANQAGAGITIEESNRTFPQFAGIPLSSVLGLDTPIGGSGGGGIFGN